MWMDTYDAVFFISIGSMIIGFMGLLIKYCLKSKCEHFNLCFGLLKIDRRVDLEVQEEMSRIEHGIPEEDEIPQVQNPASSAISQKRPSISNKSGHDNMV